MSKKIFGFLLSFLLIGICEGSLLAQNNAAVYNYSKHQITTYGGVGFNGLDGIGLGVSVNYALRPTGKLHFESMLFFDHFYGDGGISSGIYKNTMLLGVGAGARWQISPLQQKLRWSIFGMGITGYLTDDKIGDYDLFYSGALGISASLKNKHSLTLGTKLLINWVYLQYGFTF